MTFRASSPQPSLALLRRLALSQDPARLGGTLLSLRLSEINSGSVLNQAWLEAIPERHGETVTAAEQLVREIAKL
jgi:hypothetical protein